MYATRAAIVVSTQAGRVQMKSLSAVLEQAIDVLHALCNECEFLKTERARFSAVVF